MQNFAYVGVERQTTHIKTGTLPCFEKELLPNDLKINVKSN